ncbi:hypothetical protein PQR57_44590 [Paraburkholderia dipogonis]|uniref:Uncharacterized protein n=1 Tax=Paraburkholderia dipogonis TaxID=1211383 RepID=A0ABW9B4Y8_9BURK
MLARTSQTNSIDTGPPAGMTLLPSPSIRLDIYPVARKKADAERRLKIPAIPRPSQNLRGRIIASITWSVVVGRGFDPFNADLNSLLVDPLGKNNFHMKIASILSIMARSVRHR